MKTTIFISDLHLNRMQPELTALWHDFVRNIIQSHDNKIEALYILGDFFALWVGDDDLSIFNLEISRTLREIAQYDIKVYLLPGNRDFILGEDFAERSNCTLLSEPCKIDLYGAPTLLLHGDVLCAKDYMMRAFRLVTRGKWCKKLFLSLPLRWRQWIADRVRNLSVKRQRGKADAPTKILEIDEEMVNALLRQYDARQMIHGHVHRAGVHVLPGGMRRIVLDEWLKENGNAIFYYEDGSYINCNLKQVFMVAGK